MKSHKELTCQGDCRQGRDCYCSDWDAESPHWFEMALYVIKSILAGLGLIFAIFLLGYWSTL